MCVRFLLPVFHLEKFKARKKNWHCRMSTEKKVTKRKIQCEEHIIRQHYAVLFFSIIFVVVVVRILFAAFAAEVNVAYFVGF